MASLCHVLIPHSSSLIVITCIVLMRLIGIDSQMIAMDETWILLYKDIVLSHSASLEEKHEFKLRVATMRNALESGVERTKREKEQK